MARIVDEFTKGLWKEIPPFRFVLGLCPVLACSTTVWNGFGMGLCLTFVVVCSNIIISLLRKVIPGQVRIACFIVIIATFVIIIERVTEAYVYGLYKDLGIFIPLIVVNCIVLGRAEAFASKAKNTLPLSIADGLGMGLGFTLSLTALALIREPFGLGTITLPPFIHEGPIRVMWASYEPFSYLQKPPGAFLCLGLMLGFMNMIGTGKKS